MLTPGAQAISEHEKSRKGEPCVQIVHHAIVGLEKGFSSASSKNKTQSIISEMSNVQTGDSGRTNPNSRISDKKRQVNRTD
jgi:hypothetical protein